MRPQFQLEEQTATLVHINPRPEKHGEENVPAADLKISVTDSNHLLSMFHPTLRGMLYKADESEGRLEGVEAPLTMLRFGGLIERLRLGFSLKGADVVIGFGLGGFGYHSRYRGRGFFRCDRQRGRVGRAGVPGEGQAQRRSDQEAVRGHGLRDHDQRDAGDRQARQPGLADGGGVTP